MNIFDKWKRHLEPDGHRSIIGKIEGYALPALAVALLLYAPRFVPVTTLDGCVSTQYILQMLIVVGLAWVITDSIATALVVALIAIVLVIAIPHIIMPDKQPGDVLNGMSDKDFFSYVLGLIMAANMNAVADTSSNTGTAPAPVSNISSPPTSDVITAVPYPNPPRPTTATPITKSPSPDVIPVRKTMPLVASDSSMDISDTEDDILPFVTPKTKQYHTTEEVVGNDPGSNLVPVDHNGSLSTTKTPSDNNFATPVTHSGSNCHCSGNGNYSA